MFPCIKYEELQIFSLATGTGLCEDAMRILGKVGQTYRGSTSYHFEGTTVSETWRDDVFRNLHSSRLF